MAALAWNKQDEGKAFRLLESAAYTNLTGVGTTLVVTKAVAVPTWALYAKWFLYVDLMTGTSPLLDFTIRIPDLATGGAPGDGTLFGIAGWDGITQLTAAASPDLTTIDMGPGVTGIADDDTGSATASGAYHLNCILPPVLAYTYTLDATTNDEDYTFRIAVYFSGRSR